MKTIKELNAKVEEYHKESIKHEKMLEEGKSVPIKGAFDIEIILAQLKQTEEILKLIDSSVIVTKAVSKVVKAGLDEKHLLHYYQQELKSKITGEKNGK